MPVSERVATAIPGARYEVLEGSAHLPHLEAHPRCLAVIRDFLDDLPTP